jgi:hypothetical protein
LRAYAAGLLDGEGCIRWNRTPTVEITNKHLGVLLMLSNIWKGKVREKNPGVFVWCAYGDNAVRFLQEVGRYTIIKFPQVFHLLKARYSKSDEQTSHIENVRRLKRVYTD